MDPLDAISLVNFIPRNNNVELRAGHEVFATDMGSTVIRTLHEHLDTNGVAKLLACTNNGDIFDASNPGAATLIGTGASSDIWSWAMMDGFSVGVNGENQCKKYTVGGGLSDTVFTNINLVSDDKFVQVNAYRGKLYFVEKDTANIWYAADGAISGAVARFPVGKIFARGGHALWTATWTRETGANSDDILVIASSNGEILLYRGADPAASDWTLTGRVEVASLLGRRSFFRNGPDLVIITQNGVYPLSALLAIGQANQYSNLSDKISGAFGTAGKDYGSLAGWCGLLHDKGRFGFINIPISLTSFKQYVFNPQNRSWCCFTGLNGYSWVVYKDDLYFGGINGKVYKADTGKTDNNASIAAECHWAYNYLRNRRDEKRFIELTPIMSTDGTLNVTISSDVDFKNKASSSTVTIRANNGQPWNTGPWNSFRWGGGEVYVKRNCGTRGLGRNISPRISGAFSGTTLNIESMQVLYEIGGIR